MNLLSERGIDRVVTVDIKPLPSSGHLRHYLFIPGIILFCWFEKNKFKCFVFDLFEMEIYSAWCSRTRSIDAFSIGFRICRKRETRWRRRARSLVWFFTFLTEFFNQLSCCFSYHGVSRSAALVISYLIKKYQISTEESLARQVNLSKLPIWIFKNHFLYLFRLQSARPSVLPNDGFMAQLRLYEILLELDPKMESVVAKWYRLQKSIPGFTTDTFSNPNNS